MYSLLKKITTDLLSPETKFKIEPYARKAMGIFYLGKKHHCNICEAHFSKFISIASGDLLCPFCGSLPRQRRLWMTLKNDFPLHGSVLHFSPSRPIFRRLKKNKNLEYVSSDLVGEFMADQSFDITDIHEKDERFDFIICFHVLEHVENDAVAMGELFRVLKKGGIVFIQTPFKEGDIYEDFSIRSEAARLEHFGQEDHVRIYSVNGLAGRLKKAGFQVDIKKY
jgi:SAM-dependent methyltransferase